MTNHTKYPNRNHMRLTLLLAILFIAAGTSVFAQDQNPFQAIGKKGKILTLSNGKYDELFDQQDIQQVGTALVNIRTMKVVKLLGSEEDAQRLLDNSTSGRFLSADPKMNSFPWWSPYQFAGNTPIQAMDLDGKEIYFYTWDQKKQDQTAIQKVGEIDVIKQQSDIAFLTDLFGIRSTQTANLKDLGVEQTWILYDNNWRLVPNNKLNQSLDKISKQEWNSFLTPEKAKQTLDNIKGLGDKAGLAVNVLLIADGLRNLYKSVKSVSNVFNGKNISIVSEHLEQFGERAENKIMLERMNAIRNGELEATEIDKNFMAHELREQELEAGGMGHDAAHEQVLKEQNMYHRDYEKKIYTKEALDAGNVQMRKEN
jgi:hypothetical protein